MKKLKIAIDGPAGTGKSTTARILAKLLGYSHVDTGAMYRAVSYWVIKQGISPFNKKEISKKIKHISIQQKFHKGKLRTYVQNIDVTRFLHNEKVENAVSIISSYKSVRDRLVQIQRKIAKRGGVVMEGRDIGTVVLPRADVKIFMHAKPEIRAKRRWQEMVEKNIPSKFSYVLKNIKERDNMDKKRKNSPLRIPHKAFVIDTSFLTVEEQVNQILAFIKKNGKYNINTHLKS